MIERETGREREWGEREREKRDEREREERYGERERERWGSGGEDGGRAERGESAFIAMAYSFLNIKILQTGA